MAYDAPGGRRRAWSRPVPAYRVLLLLPGGGVGRYARPAVPLARGTCDHRSFESEEGGRGDHQLGR
eukprot:1818415-Prymnesium_polylepis.1